MRLTPKVLIKLFSFLLVILTFNEKSSGQKVGETCDSHLGTLGLCTPARDCSHAAKDLFDGVELAKCSYVPKLFVICCLDDAPTEDQAGRPRNSSESVSRKKCDEYAKPTYTEHYRTGLSLSSTPVLVRTTNCISVSGLTVGGVEAKIGEFPHMAAIGWRTTNKNRRYDFKCGGSLISDKFVLTVAHCNSKDGSAPVIVRLGDHNIKSTDYRVQELDVDIKKIIVHEKYDNVKKVNDIALIELQKTVTFTDKIRPACLWQDDEEVVPNKKVIAAGWGDTVADVNVHKDSDVLMKVELVITPQDECRKSWWDNFRVRVVNANICAGTPTGGIDTCQGDSGGPLMVTKEGNTCLYYIVGLTSAGPAECGKKGYYGLYTRVPSYLDWIENIVWK